MRFESFWPQKIIKISSIKYLLFIFFSVRERAEFNQFGNLIGSGSERNFPIRPALSFIKNVSILSGNLLNDLCYYVSKNISVKALQFNLDYFCFHYYLPARNCLVCRESRHDYSPKMFGSFTRLSLRCRKKCLQYRNRPAASGGILAHNLYFSVKISL